MEIKLPNFVVIGAPKSGTTSLYFYLQQHPEIYLPKKKELHYFSYSKLIKQANGPGDSNTISGLCSSKDEYEAHFLNVKNEHAICDVSPSYLAAGVHAQIKHELGNVRIVVMLRNPIEKAFSQYMHLIRDQRETLSFYDALLAEEDRRAAGWSDMWHYAHSSLYSERLDDFFSCFGRDNVHVIVFDDFANDANNEMHRLFNFLGIDSSVSINADEVHNRSGVSKVKWLSILLSRESLIKKYVRQIVPTGIRQKMRKKIFEMNTKQKPSIDDQSKAYLTDYFSNEIRKLEGLLDRELDWK